MGREQARRVALKTLGILRRQYGRVSANAHRTPLEELLLGILAVGASERKASAALATLNDSFVDLNEARVTAEPEIAAILADLPQPDLKAAIIRRILHRIFEHGSELSLDYLKEKTALDAAALVKGIAGFPEPALSRATVLGLGQQVFPLTEQVMTVCTRIGLFDEGTQPSVAQENAASFVPKTSMFEFHSLLYQHAVSMCGSTPACEKCRLASHCRAAKSNAAHKPRRKASPAASLSSVKSAGKKIKKGKKVSK